MASTFFSAQSKKRAREILKPNASMDTYLSWIVSKDESLISQAKNVFRCAKILKPDLFLKKLISNVCDASDINLVQSFALVLESSNAHTLWPTLSIQEREYYMGKILNFVKNQESVPLSRNLCGFFSESLCEVYNCRIGDLNWNDLLDFLVKSTVSDTTDPKFKEIALLVFANLPTERKRKGYLISDVLVHYKEDLHNGLLSSLSSTDLDVKNAAIGASVSLISLFSSNDENLDDFVLAVVNGVLDMLNRGEEARGQKGLQELVKLVIVKPRVFSSRLLNRVLKSVYCETNNILTENMFTNETRRWAFKFLISVLEARPLATELQALYPECIEDLFNIAKNYILHGDVDHDDLWREIEFREKKSGKIGTYGDGMNMLNKMSIAFGGEKIVPIAFKVLPDLMEEPDQWRTRHAGITMLGVIAKHCWAEIVSMQDHLVTSGIMIIASFEDIKPQVRWAGFHVVYQATHLVASIQYFNNTAKIVPELVQALDNNQDPRVAEELASAVLSLVTSFSHLISLVSDGLHIDIFDKLLSFVEGNNRSPRCRAITFHIISILAAELPSQYLNHYDRILQSLLGACTHLDSKLKKEAIRGIRVCAEFGGSNFKTTIPDVLQTLQTMIRIDNQSSADDLKASDVAVCAVCKICEFHPDRIEVPEILHEWLDLLPIKHDLTEAKDAHHTLCVLVERLDLGWEIFDTSNEFSLKIVNVFVEVISQGTNLAKQETVNKMKDLLKRWPWVNLPDYMNLNSLTPRARNQLITMHVE